MSLSLATPTGAVTTFDGGVVAVRCSDYPGASRASLTTPTDAKSVAGDAVRDEQALAVQTTFAAQGTMWAAADDSVVIPLADLGLVEGVEYEIYVGARVTGEAPANAQALSDWLTYDEDGASVGFGMGFDNGVGFWAGAEKIARARVEEYLLYDVAVWDHGDVAADNMILRGWGITGGDIAVLFDMVYLLPAAVWDSSLAAGLGDDDVASFSTDSRRALVFAFNGGVPRDQDDASTAIGTRSVLDFSFPWVEDSGIVDLQDANDEPTVVDLNGNGLWDDDPSSYLALVAGAVHIPAETLTVEDFDQPDSGNTPGWENDDGLVSFMGPGTLNPGSPPNPKNGWRFEGGLARCYIAKNQSIPSYANMGLFSGSVTPGGSGTDPRDGRMMLGPVQRGGILTARFRFDTSQAQAVELGFHSGKQTGALDCRVMRVELDSSDNAEVSLLASSTLMATGNERFTFASAVSVLAGYTVGDWIMLKVQVRGYHWRARVWLDGDTEPSTWDVEGHEPLSYRNSGNTVKGWLAYPWDWASLGADGDTILTDPRLGDTVDSYDESSVTVIGWVEASQPADSHMECTLVQVDWEPDGDTPDDMHLAVEKYDGSALDGSVTVPYGPHRIVLGDARVRRYSGDTHGFNMVAWKDSGSPTLQTSGVGDVYERRLPSFMPHIYRRTVGAAY